MGKQGPKTFLRQHFPCYLLLPSLHGGTEFSQVPDHAELPIFIPNDEALLPHNALPVTPDWKGTIRGSQQLVLGFSEEKPTSKKRKKKSLPPLLKWLNWEGLEVTFWSISTVRGEPFHKCWGWTFPARVWWLVTHQKEVFLLFCESFCVGQSMTNQVPAVICPRLLHDILSKILLLYCLQTPPPHAAPAGKGTYHPSEVLMRNLPAEHAYSTSQYFCGKCIIFLRKKQEEASENYAIVLFKKEFLVRKLPLHVHSNNWIKTR